MTTDLFPLAAVWDGDLLTVPADEPTPEDLRPVDLEDDGYEVDR